MCPERRKVPLNILKNQCGKHNPLINENEDNQEKIVSTFQNFCL